MFKSLNFSQFVFATSYNWNVSIDFNEQDKQHQVSEELKNITKKKKRIL